MDAVYKDCKPEDSPKEFCLFFIERLWPTCNKWYLERNLSQNIDGIRTLEEAIQVRDYYSKNDDLRIVKHIIKVETSVV